VSGELTRGSAPSRPTRSGLLGAMASCTCGWSYEGNNALGLAAQHYDRCGGTVHVEITRVVIYG
jgi:hypothetical protein